MDRFLRFALVLFAVTAFALSMGAGSAYAKEKKIPEDFIMTDVGDAGKVTFSHNGHLKNKAGEELKCTTCHPKVFKLERGATKEKMGPLTMKAMEDGSFCGNCHNGTTSFSVKAKENCKRCHSK